MFKLKQVYGTLCFEHAKIKLVVLEKQANRVNCLYMNELSFNYLDDNFKIINSDEFRNKLFNLVRSADEFLNMNIKRYILHVSCLPMQTISSTSAVFLIFNQKLTQDNYNTYINKYRNQNIGGDNLALEINPTSWTLDDHKYHDFPIDMTGKEMSFNFNALTCSEKLVNQFIDLLTSLKLKVIKITNNSLCLASSLTKRNGVDNLVIDIKSRNAVINLYD
jgi:cell division ATPase FtsA